MNALLLATLAIAAQSPAAQVPQADSVARLRKAAREAEARYESLVRRLAPLRLGGFGSGCDEIVGRYCLRYDSPDDELPPPEPEPPELTDARRAAIEALRSACAFLPGDFETAGPLVRYLVEDGRSQEALPVARLFRAASADSIWGPLLEGFVLHSLEAADRAESAFRLALTRLSRDERERFETLDWLLERDDRRAYRDLAPDDRDRFHRRFWRLTDPLYLTPGNEALTEHLARHVWSRILKRAPVVLGAQRWGSDLEQLTVRFGTPARRTRIPGRVGFEESIVEHFDPRQLAYTPEALLTAGFPPTPVPGEPWELARKRTRAGYAAQTVKSLTHMPHQVSRFPTPDGALIRVDGAFGDSVPSTRSTMATGLWLLDEPGRTLAEVRESVEQQSDTTLFHFEVSAGHGSWIYSIEAIDPADSTAARARYAIEVEPLADGPRISDPVIVRPFGQGSRPEGRDDPAFQPFASLTFTTTDTIAVYVEGVGLRPGGPARLRLSLQPASRGNLPVRMFRWIGRKIGLASSHDPVFVEWSANADADGRLVLAFELPPQQIDDGDHVLVAHLTDLVNGLGTESRRVIRFVEPSS